MKRLFSTRMGGFVILALAVATGLGFEVARVGAVTAAPVNDYVRAIQYVSTTSASSKADTKTATATCPAGKTATGGGVEINRAGFGIYSTVTSKPVLPSSAGTGGWTGTATGVSTTSWSITVWAVCADVNGQAPSTTSGGSSGTTSGGSSGTTSGGSSGTSSGGSSGTTSSGGSSGTTA